MYILYHNSKVGDVYLQSIDCFGNVYSTMEPYKAAKFLMFSEARLLQKRLNEQLKDKVYCAVGYWRLREV